MAALIPNIAKGKFARYAELPETGDNLKWIILQSASLEADATLRDYDSVSAILGGTSSEATFTGYSRQVATGVTVTVDDTNDRVDIAIDNPSWSPTSAQAQGKIILAYDPTGSSADTDLVPLFMDDFSVTTATSGTLEYDTAAVVARAS